MKVCGIIAEYNPFHNGHEYHLRESLKRSEADYKIVVMSGNFVQRGEPALLDKHIRTEAALRCGADLVLELPAFYAAGSAEYFAAGAVALLAKTGVVTHLCFGSECGDIALLQEFARIYAEEPEDFQESLRFKLKTGLSFPAARAAALLETRPALSTSLSVLSSPNNILGIEYIKALLRRNSTIKPLTIFRNGSGYHDRELNSPLSSATALRQAIENGIPLQQLSSQVPGEALAVYDKYFAEHAPVFMDDFSALLHYRLLSEQHTGYTDYMDVSEDLSDRIVNNIYRFTTFSSFCDLLKTRELTYSRISRCLLHILLNIRKDEVDKYVSQLDYVPYARILGFRKDAAPLLHELGRCTEIPLISKLADAGKILEEPALQMLRRDIMISHIYSSVCAGKSILQPSRERLMKNEYTTPIVIL